MSGSMLRRKVLTKGERTGGQEDCGCLHEGIFRGCRYRRLTAKERIISEKKGMMKGENIAGKLGESEGDLRLAG